MRRAATLVLIVASFFSYASAKKSNPQLVAELAQITARGRKLAEYHIALTRASNAVRALNGPLGIIHDMAGEKTAHGWDAVFGELNAQGDKFWVAYEATQQPGTDNFTAVRYDPPKAEGGYFCLAAKAIRTARRAFHGQNRPYEADVLPAGSNRFYVYVYPAQTTAGVYVYGGDVRYLISPDGATIIESRQMHKSIMESRPSQVPRGAKFEGGVHSHVLSDVPEDTDVLLVLTRKPSSPETIGTKNHVFLINPDGSIKVEK